MTIIHLIDDFLSELFPRFKESGNDLDVLREDLEKFYSFGSYKPVVSIEGQLVRIEVDVPAIMSQEADFRRAANLCEAGKFQDAKPIMTRLIEKNPTHSEYHRVLGQVYSEEGDQEAAIDALIEALRWDPKNGYALLMMGNIFAKFKNDIETATIYFDQAVKAKPEDNIAVNNIGATLLQQGRTGEAEKYFRKALEIDPNYPNTHYALGLIAEMAGDYTKAFTHTIEAIRVNKKKDVLLQNSLKQAINAAMKAIENSNLEQLVRDYLHGLEFEADVKIELKQDADIPTAAKIEFAENYGRDHHVIRFKPGYPAVEHLIMHELVHLDFVLQARKEGENQLFVSTQSHKSSFIKSLEPALKRLSKMGIAEDSLARYATDLFEGMNRQVFNTPIDLFIEQKLYDDFPTLRPCQFLSLYQLMNENVKAVTDKKIVELTPKDILSKSRTFNLIYALQFRDLYGLDMVEDLKAPPGELKEAIRLYEEYLEYKDDRAPGEEYELVKHWAEDLKLDDNFELIDEETYRARRSDPTGILESIEKDPLGLESTDPEKEREMKKFQDKQKEMGTNMAVVMYMVDALKYFEGMAKEEIRSIAMEIALQGTQGYRPEKEDYRISKIPGKLFSGYHILAYYYVSWKIAIPEMLSQLQLPFDEEYQLALSLYNSEKK